MKPTKEWLKAARDHIEKNGWVQGSYSEHGAGNGCCMIGALVHTSAHEGGTRMGVYSVEESQATLALASIIGLTMDETPAATVIHYNDAANRTYEEVLAVFDKAIRCAPEDR